MTAPAPDACSSCDAELCESCGGCPRPEPTTCQGAACICPGHSFRPDDMPAESAEARRQRAADDREYWDDRVVDEMRDDQLERGRRP